MAIVLRHRLCAFLLPLLAAVGCATPIDLPTDFVHLEGGEGFQAVTADDARLWVRELHDPNEAGLEFWSQALLLDLTERRGHERIGDGEVRDAAGAPGRWFELAANVRGERVGYLVALWVGGREVCVVEFAARQEVFDRRVAAVRSALVTVRR